MTQDFLQSPGQLSSGIEMLDTRGPTQANLCAYQESRLFVFEFAQMIFSVPLHYVEEVIESHKIESYPGSVPHCRGTINHRGRILPIFDVHGLGFEKDKEDVSSPYVVIINNIVNISNITNINNITFQPFNRYAKPFDMLL